MFIGARADAATESFPEDSYSTKSNAVVYSTPVNEWDSSKQLALFTIEETVAIV